MEGFYPTKLVKKVTQATDNQLKYWVKIGLLRPSLIGRVHQYSFRDIVTIKHIINLKTKGLSLQRIKKGIGNLAKALPDDVLSLSRLRIYTDGTDMIIIEKGLFSAITGQGYLVFDTEEIRTEIIDLYERPDKKVASAQR